MPKVTWLRRLLLPVRLLSLFVLPLLIRFASVCQGPKDHADLLRCKRQTHTVNDGSRGRRGVALESRTHTDLLERLAPTFDLRGTLVHTESRSVALSAKYLDPLRSGGI